MWLAVDERIIRCEEALPGALQGDVFKKVLQAAEQRGFEVPQYLKTRPIFRGESVKVGDTRMRIPARSIKVSTEGYKVE